ncbi:MAG: hydroxyacid dehydrogenase [Nitrospinae bacterium]|nr:hydroxyacid dehydrogenase [Nitrospinota bacterium]
MANLLIIDAIADQYKAYLQPKFPGLSITTARTPAEAGELLNDAQILAVLAPRLRGDDIEKARRLEWVQAFTTGVDNLLAFPCLKKETVVTNCRGIHGPQMSELAVLLMLSLSRGFHRIVKNQERKLYERWPMPLLEKKTVGIFGIGAIGEEVARKSKAFGMRVIGITSTKRNIEWIDEFYSREELPAAAAESDFFIVVAPLSPETEKIVNEKLLSAMKPTGFLINISRGGVVDEEALIAALQNGQIAGAGLDVFQMEPLPEESPLWEMENVIITPHIGGYTDNYIEQVMPIFEENLRRFLDGEKDNLINTVDR